MQITTSNGTILDSTDLSAPILNEHVKNKLGREWNAWLATFTDGTKEYVITRGNPPEVIYGDTSLENVACHIDALSIANNFR